MTPIDNAILSEMLDNCLSDIKYLRQEVSALREAKAEAKAEAYELREEVADLRAEADANSAMQQALADEAQDRFEENRDLSREIGRLRDEAKWDAATVADLQDQLALYQDNCECAQ